MPDREITQEQSASIRKYLGEKGINPISSSEEADVFSVDQESVVLYRRTFTDYDQGGSVQRTRDMVFSGDRFIAELEQTGILEIPNPDKTNSLR